MCMRLHSSCAVTLTPPEFCSKDLFLKFLESQDFCFPSKISAIVSACSKFSTDEMYCHH